MARGEMIYRYSKDCYMTSAGVNEENISFLLVVEGNTFSRVQEEENLSIETILSPTFWRERVGEKGVTIEEEHRFWLRPLVGYDRIEDGKRKQKWEP